MKVPDDLLSVTWRMDDWWARWSPGQRRYYLFGPEQQERIGHCLFAVRPVVGCFTTLTAVRKFVEAEREALARIR